MQTGEADNSAEAGSKKLVKWVVIVLAIIELVAMIVILYSRGTF